MNICVVGLGLIGGSLCMALRRAGYSVEGWNRSKAPLDYALEHNIICGIAENFTKYDVVFLALPPRATADFIDSHCFKDGAVISDICGVKSYIARRVHSRPRNFFYVGTHPMAGKEVSGIENACEDLFDRASMVITPEEDTDTGALSLIKQLVADMGFRRIVQCSAEYHDAKIAYTSQLAHVVSNAYIKDEGSVGCTGFTGGSFQDMTRIAGVDEGVWSELFLLNAENLCKNISTLTKNLEKIRACISSGDEGALRAVLKEGRECFARSKDSPSASGVTVTLLKRQ